MAVLSQDVTNTIGLTSPLLGSVVNKDEGCGKMKSHFYDTVRDFQASTIGLHACQTKTQKTPMELSRMALESNIINGPACYHHPK